MQKDSWSVCPRPKNLLQTHSSKEKDTTTSTKLASHIKIHIHWCLESHESMIINVQIHVCVSSCVFLFHCFSSVLCPPKETTYFRHSFDKSRVVGRPIFKSLTHRSPQGSLVIDNMFTKPLRLARREAPNIQAEMSEMSAPVISLQNVCVKCEPFVCMTFIPKHPWCWHPGLLASAISRLQCWHGIQCSFGTFVQPCCRLSRCSSC